MTNLQKRIEGLEQRQKVTRRERPSAVFVHCDSDDLEWRGFDAFYAPSPDHIIITTHSEEPIDPAKWELLNIDQSRLIRQSDDCCARDTAISHFLILDRRHAKTEKFAKSYVAAAT